MGADHTGLRRSRQLKASMFLARHALHRYRLPYARAVRWSDIVEDGADFVLLHLESDTGHEGVAESVLKPTWNGASARSIAAALEDLLLPLLLNVDISDPQQVSDRLASIPGHQAAKTLLDNALWDLHASAGGKPLWKLWEGTNAVAVSWVLTRQSPALMAREAADMVDRFGFGTLKIKGGQGLATDVAALHEVAAAVGSSVRLYVDANAAYPPHEAPHYMRALCEAGAVAVEDPCALVPGNAFQRLQQDVPVPVLVDFGCESPRDAALFIERGAKALSLKPGRLGLSASRTMGRLLEDAGGLAVVGMFGESALGTVTALSLAATLPHSSLAAETTWFLSMTQQILDLPAISCGELSLPDTPGMARHVDWERLEYLKSHQS